MANYATLKAAIADVVKTNGEQEITGANLQTVLLAIVNSIGSEYTFAGVATPSTSVGTPDQNVFFIGGAGTYANFGTSVTVLPTNIAVFKYNGTWTCEQVTVENGGVFDITAYNNNTTYADLAAALGTNGANVPEGIRKGGMSIKFVQTSDNKYIQYRLMNNQFSTTESDWQGVDSEPIYGSNNLVTSGGVEKNIRHITHQQITSYSDNNIIIKDENDNVIATIDESGANFSSLKENGEKLVHKKEESTQLLKKEIVFEDKDGNIVGTIDESGANFSSLKENGEKLVNEGGFLKNNGCIEYIKKNSLNFPTRSTILSTTQTNIPIVVFIYDDNDVKDDILISMLDERGLKGTIATIGTINNLTPSNPLGVKLNNWIANGHGTVGHGLVSGVNVTIHGSSVLPGISNIDDEDAYNAIVGNNLFLDTYGLSHKGIAYWNTLSNVPHFRRIVSKFYNYAFVFGGSGYIDMESDFLWLPRYVTDNDTMLSGAKALVDKAIGHNCIIAFGGHMARTGRGSDGYSTMADFTELLDYVADKVSNHQLISLNADDAIAEYSKRMTTCGCIRSVAPLIPSKGNTYNDNGVKVCIDEGELATFSIEISGTPTNGNIVVSELSIMEGTDLMIETSSSMSVEDVIDEFLNQVYTDCTVIKESSSKLRIIYDITGEKLTPEITTNTSGLTLSITKIIDGESPIWI